MACTLFVIIYISQGEKIMYDDLPIKEIGQDKLDRDPFAKRLARIIKEKESSPFIVGLYGKWGEGKTSTLFFVEKELKDNDLIVLWFNPWYYSSVQQLIVQFLDTIRGAISRTSLADSAKKEISRCLMKYGRILSVPFPDYSGTNIISWFGKALTWIGSYLKVSNSNDIAVLKEEIVGKLAMMTNRIVIIIDDIDRLDKDEIFSLFKLVKLAGDFPGITYLMAFDPNIVNESLSDQYAEAGSEFIKKIIQIELFLPPAPKDKLRIILIKSLFEILDKNGISMDENTAYDLVNVFDRSVSPNLDTLRTAKRFLNSIYFALPILKGEVNYRDQVLIEALRYFYPSIYDLIRRNPDVIFNLGKRDSHAVEDSKLFFAAVIDKLDKKYRDGAVELISELFPQAGVVWGKVGYDTSHWSQEWGRDQKICSEKYFDKYFQYAVPSGDVSDVKIKELLKTLKDASVKQEEVIASINDLMKNSSARSIITKLRLQEAEIDEIGATRLIEALTLIGKDLQKRDGYAGTWGSSRDEWAKQIARLLMKIPKQKREDLSLKIITEIPDLRIAVDLIRWFSSSKEQKIIDNENLLKEIYKVFAERILGVVKDEKYFDVYGDDAPALLYFCKHGLGADTLIKVLDEKFTKSLDEATKFLAGYLGFATTVETGKTHMSEFRREEYDAINNVYPVDKLYSLLSKKYKPAEERALGTDSSNKYESVARQFLRLHDIVKTQGKAIP